MALSPQAKQLLADTNARVLEPWLGEHAEVPEVLYHYTSAEGLIGILQSRSIWLTDLRYMNDSSELQYARTLVEARIENKRATDGLSTTQQEFLRRVQMTFDPFKHGSSVFAASFCEAGNLLSQWRAYRGRGGGYAIGIDFFHTLRFLSRPSVLRRVVYDKAAQERLLDTVIEQFLITIDTFSTDRPPEDIADFLPIACQHFAAVIGEFLFALKHPDFIEEREWRLVHFAHVDPRMNRGVVTPQVRSYEGNVIPYFIVEFKAAVEASKDDTSGIPFPIAELVIGPTVGAQLNRQSVKTLLLSMNPDVEPRIKESEIPLRWL
jgi:hypothetical protein